MGAANYNENELKQLYEDSTKIPSQVEEITTALNQSYESFDTRIQRKYSEIFNKLLSTNKSMTDEIADANQYSNWINTTNTDYLATKQTTIDIANESGNQKGLDKDLENQTTNPNNPNKREEEKQILKDIANMPTKTKEVVKQKLKELGYNDAEIEKIMNGEINIDKTQLNNISSQLEQALKNDPTLRQRIIDLYGFDVFNPDGTINKDKLALAMAMDAKNPKDKYEITSLITHEEVIHGKTPLIEPNVLPKKPEDNPISSNNDILNNSNNKSDTPISEKLETINANKENLAEALENGELLENDESLSDLAGALSNHNEVLPNGSTKIKKGSLGAVGAIAGVGSAVAAAAGGISFAKKKKTEEFDENGDPIEDDEEYEDDEFIDNDEKTDEDDDKDWLYGLGIGLTGAGSVAAALSDKDKDKDEDNENNDDEDSSDEDDNNGYYPSFK